MIEIERKFLVRANAWPRSESRVEMRQGYMAQTENLVCRVRQKDETYYLSIKAAIDDLSSYDYEYPVPAEDGRVMLDKLCSCIPVSKTRHLVDHGSLVWEIDEFHAANAGLVVAEIELPSADYALDLPDWVCDEVTEDKRYRNANLYFTPWSSWKQVQPSE